MSDGAGVIIAGPAVVGQFLATFKDFPPSQRAASFSIDQLIEKMQRSFELPRRQLITPAGRPSEAGRRLRNGLELRCRCQHANIVVGHIQQRAIARRACRSNCKLQRTPACFANRSLWRRLIHPPVVLRPMETEVSRIVRFAPLSGTADNKRADPTRLDLLIHGRKFVPRPHPHYPKGDTVTSYGAHRTGPTICAAVKIENKIDADRSIR